MINRDNKLSESYHELHVSSSRCLSAGRRNLLTEISSWYDLFRQSHAVVGKVDAFQSLANDWVVVDRSGDVVEQFDDQLCHVVARRSLHTKVITATWFNEVSIRLFC